MRAPRRLAVDGDDVGGVVAQAGDPIREARREQRRIGRVQHVGQRVVAWNIVPERQISAQEAKVLQAPFAHLDEIVGASDRRSHEEPHDLLQRKHERKHDPGALARIGQA